VAVGKASVMLVLDHSGSMEATDVRPSRIAAAKHAAGTFIDNLPHAVRVGVVAFGSVPDAAQGPTTNRGAVLQVIDTQIATGGTATGSALELALRLLGGTAPAQASNSRSSGDPRSSGNSRSSGDPPRREPAAIVLLSDGAANVGRDPVQVATE